MSFESEHTAVRIDELQKLHEQIAILREALERITTAHHPNYGICYDIAREALQRAGGGE